MNLIPVLRKSLKEQIRQYWLLLLTLSMAPFFILVYYLIDQASKPVYDIVLVNEDTGIRSTDSLLNYGEFLIRESLLWKGKNTEIPLKVTTADTREEALRLLMNRKSDAALVIPSCFSSILEEMKTGITRSSPEFEIIGDLTSVEYMISAVWAEEVIQESLSFLSGIPRPYKLKESPLGISGEISSFDLYVPGILILSVIMLMFTATISLVTEVEQQTITRMRLSRLSTSDLLCGNGIVQILIGFLSISLTLGMALLLGFRLQGSFPLFCLITLLCCISIISFSLILAALTKTVNEVLIAGNFPFFLFMFFTGAAFPMSEKALFNLGAYPFSLQGFLSPTHAVTAMKKVLVFGNGLREILPELCCLIVLSLLYFLAGILLFRRRHMKRN